MADVETRNLQISIEELKQERRAIADDITSATIERKNIRIEVGELMSSKKKLNDDLSDLVSKCIDSKNRTLKLNTDFDNIDKFRRNEIGVLDKEKRDTSKELARLNNYILSGKQSIEELENKLSDMGLKISLRQPLFDEVLKLENDKAGLEQNKIDIEKENNTLLTDRKNRLYELHNEVDSVLRQIDRLKLDAEYAQNNLTRIQKEQAKKIDDLNTYHERIKKAWNLVFPGRNMPMLR